MNTTAIVEKITAQCFEGQVDHRTETGRDSYGSAWVALIVISPERPAETLRVYTNDNVLHLVKADRFGYPTGVDAIAITNPTEAVALAAFSALFAEII